MMTREEIVREYEAAVAAHAAAAAAGIKGAEKSYQLFKAGLSALRPVSREQVEKEWRGEWVGMTDDNGCTWYECSRCEHDLDIVEEPNHFCPTCGAPMTDEAVDMVMERLEALYETI